MLQRLREQTQSFGFKVLVGILVIALAVFGFGAANLFVDADPTIASVNGEDIPQSLVIQEASREQRRLQAQLGEDFNPDMIDPARLQTLVINQLIGRELLNQAVDDLAMGVSDEQVDEVLVNNPNFQSEGQFDREAYLSLVRTMNFSPEAFRSYTREQLALQQLQGGIVDTAFYPRWELQQAARLVGQRRDLAYLEFDAEDFAEAIVIDDEAVALHYEDNQRRYMTPERLDVAYVELSVDDLMDDPAIAIDEQTLRDAYEAEKAEAPLQEQRRSRHILLTTGDDRTQAEAEAALREVKARVEAGEAFADLARELSEDPGSAPAGGDLGSVGRGVFDPAFEDALWALEEGELSEPVTSTFGVHLIKLEAIEQPEYPSFAEERAEIEARLRRSEARLLFEERLRELDNLAFEQPESLTGVAEALGLEVRSESAISEDAGSGVFGNLALREALFTAEVLDDGYNTPAVEYRDDAAVVARVTRREPPAVQPLEDVREDIREELRAERARQALADAHADALARLQGGAAAGAVAADVGLSWNRVEAATRREQGVPPAVLDAAFAVERPGALGRIVTQAAPPDGVRYVITVTRVQDGDMSAMSERELDSVRRLLDTQVANVDFASFYTTLEEQASIRRP